MPQADSPPLAAARWRKVEELYDAALALPSAERRGFLARACAGDAALQREVASLLAHDNRNAADTLLDHALTLAMQALADEETERTEMALLTVGTTLDGRYKILAELDAGGMGEVYKAQDLKFPNRLVVVKVLKPTSQNIPWIAKKFLRDEGEAQARVQHPNVANVLDKGRLPSGEHYLVVEFIPGATLRQVLGACPDRQLDFPTAAEIIHQAGRAVTAIHHARLIHRDLKPENLMVQDAADSDELLVKVIDFGIVRVLDKSTVLGQIAGTLHYLAPEQLNGNDVTPASDVYALGVIAHEMLTGRRPFNPENLAHLLKLQQEGVKLKPTALRPGLPPAAEAALLRSLSYEPRERQQSAREFGDQLSQALTAPPPPAPTPPPPITAKRRPIPVAAVALAALVLLAVIAVLLWWKLSDRSLPSTEVAAARLESQPAGGAPAAPANPRRYDVEAGFPTGPPPPGTVYATIGFTVWRTRATLAVSWISAARIQRVVIAQAS